MITEIPQYCLRAYSLFYSKHGSREAFGQNELDWIVSQSMKKKIFSILLKSGWIEKASKNTYKCVQPDKVVKGLLEFKVPEIMKQAERPYAFTSLSSIEIWSDFVYIQRGMERSPYFMKVLKKDLKYWKDFFNSYNVPNYINEGSAIGEFVVLIPVGRLNAVDKEGLYVEPLKETMKIARENEMYSYAYNYMREKYAAASA
ncbi:hypothetical protein J4212_03455 [Candidatus Woesearchaeota archaeon]|nr:hypothetical protein [Candidatus Woesearchaeota archaeon]